MLCGLECIEKRSTDDRLLVLHGCSHGRTPSPAQSSTSSGSFTAPKFVNVEHQRHTSTPVSVSALRTNTPLSSTRSCYTNPEVVYNSSTVQDSLDSSSSQENSPSFVESVVDWANGLTYMLNPRSKLCKSEMYDTPAESRRGSRKNNRAIQKQLKETKCLKEELLIKEMKFKKVVGKKEKTVKHIQEIFWMQRRRTTDEVAAFEGSKSQEIECLQMQQLDEKRKKYLQEISSLGKDVSELKRRQKEDALDVVDRRRSNGHMPVIFDKRRQ